MSGPFLVPGGQPSLWKLPLSPSSLRILRLCLQMSLYKVILLVSEGILFDLKNFALLQICWAGLSHCFLAISSPYCCDFQGREESDTGGQRFHPRFHIFFLFFLTLWFSVSHWGTSLTLFGKPSILLKSYQHILTSKSHFPLWLFHVLAHEFILWLKFCLKWATENEVVEWHHRINRYEFKQTLGGSEGQACCIPWVHKESDTT